MRFKASTSHPQSHAGTCPQTVPHHPDLQPRLCAKQFSLFLLPVCPIRGRHVCTGGTSLGCALLVCQSMLLDFLPTGTRVPKWGSKLQFSLESTFLSQPSHPAFPMPSPAHLKPAVTVLPLYQTWFPRHLVQMIAPQAVWKPSRITNFLGQGQW